MLVKVKIRNSSAPIKSIMSRICNSRRKSLKANKNENNYTKCKFKLQDPPAYSPEDSTTAIRDRAKGIGGKTLGKQQKDNQTARGRLKFQCHYEERKRRAEFRRRKILQKLNRVYKINVDGMNEHVANEIIMRVENMEREKREREKRNLEKTLTMINRLIEEQKYKRRGQKKFVPPWRRFLKSHSSDLICVEEELTGEEEPEGTRESLSTEKEISKEKVRSQVGNLADEVGTPLEKQTEDERLQEEEGEGAELPICAEKKETGYKYSIRGPLKCGKPAPLERYLESTPKRVVFQDYEEGKMHLRKLKITNIGLETIHCRYLGIVIHVKSEKRFPIGVAVRDNVKLRPGLSCSTKIRLCSEEATKELECSIVYETRRQRKPLQHSLFFVPVVCIPARAIVKVIPLKIIFPSLTWCAATGAEGAKQLKRTLKIVNSGGKSCFCKIAKAEIPVEDTWMEFYEEGQFEGEHSSGSASSKTYLEHSVANVNLPEEKSVMDFESNYGEEYFLPFNEAQSLVEELLENVFLPFRFSEKYHVEIPPFSTKHVEIRFIPHYKGFHHETHSIKFMDCYNLEEETIQLMGDIKKLPLKIEPEVIDLKTCIANGGVYSAAFRIFNESKGPYSVALKIPSSIRTHAHVHPRATTIQPLTELQLQDMRRIHSSSYSLWYRYLDWESQPQYSNYNIRIGLLRIFSQQKVMANRCLYKWDTSRICEVCNLQMQETAAHFLLQCPTYGPLCASYLHPYIEEGATPQQNFLLNEVTLGRDAPRYFREDTQILEFPIFIHPTNFGACKLDYAKIYVMALITDCTMELSPTEINFGTVTTLETVRVELQLTNHSLVIQEYGFLNLPKGVRVEPNMGFGKILPKESIPLYLLYSPESDVVKGGEGEGIHSFEVTVTTVAEYGGFKEKLESEGSTPFECIWGEDNRYDFATPKESSFSVLEEAQPEEESDDFGACDETSSIEGEELNLRVTEQENKIREFLKRDRDKISEHSFFKKVNLQAKDYETPLPVHCPESSKSQTENPRKSDSSLNIKESEEDSSDFLCPSSRPLQTVKCEALVIVPRCQISESVIQLPATPCSSFSLYRFRLNGMNDSIDGDCVCGLRSTLKKSPLCEGKPKFEGSFEFQYFCPHIKLEPESGFLKAGDSLPINVIYRPEFPAEQIRHESRIQKAEKFMKEKRTERENPPSKPITSAKSKPPSTAMSSDMIQGEDIDKIINISLYELEKYDLFAGERSLQELINPFCVETKIQCVIKTLECGGDSLKTEVHEILLICPAIKPNFIYLGESQEINFNQVFVGTRPKMVLEIQNISFERINPVISLLNPAGSFSCPAGLRKVEVDPEHIWRQPLTFAPVAMKGIEREYFEIHCGPTNIFLTVSGEGIQPEYKITPNFACCIMEAKPGSSEEFKLEIENLSGVTLNIQVKSEGTKEGKTPKREEETEPKEETKGGKDKSGQKDESKDKKKSKNTESGVKNFRIFEEIPETVLDELEDFDDLEEELGSKVFTVVGCDEKEEVAVVPSGKVTIRIRFAPPPNKNNSQYAVSYQILLERISPLKEFLIIGTLSN